MNWFTRLFNIKNDPMTSRDLLRIMGTRVSSSGVNITLDTAFEFSVLYAIVRSISEGVAQIPWRLMQEMDGKRKNLGSTQLGKLLHRKPNKLQTSFEFRETIMLHLLMTNNAYCFVGKVGIDREPRDIRPIPPQYVKVRLAGDNETPQYFVRDPQGREIEFPAENIWHIRGPSWHPHQGMDVLRAIRNTLGLAMATENVVSDLNKNGLQTSGVLSVENKLTEERYKMLSEWLDLHQPGGERFQKPLIVDLGAEWTSTQMTGVDAQHLETRKYQVEELCRPFRIMPIMIGYSDKAATYASAEQMFIAHVVHCLAPWYERIEQSADAFLLTEDQRDQGYYTKFFPDGLLRGDIASRYASYSKALGSGGGRPWLTINEVRRFQDLDDIKGGDELPQPAPAPSPPPKDDPNDPPTN